MTTTSARQPVADTGDHGTLDTLTRLVADAFLDQPGSEWLIPDLHDRQVVFRAYFGLLAAHNLAGHGCIDATEPGEAAMLWYPPGAAGPDLADEDTYERDLAALAGKYADKFNAMDALMHPAMPTRFQFAYLGFAAVDPPEQGKGIATRLLEARHKQLDADATPAFLIASTERSSRLYARLGYRMFGDTIRLGGVDGPPLFPMLRTPQN